MEEKKENTKKRNSKILKLLKQNSLFFGAFFLVVVLVAVFNNHKILKVYESGKENVQQFYSENFKPLFNNSSLTNEDVFNFALYQNIPLDKEDKSVLQISDASDGRFSYEVHPKVYEDKTTNYEKFNQYLQLGEIEQRRLDSILSVYKKKLNRSVLHSEKNQLAVNTKLKVLQEGLLVNIFSYLNNIRPNLASDAFVTDYFNNNVPIAQDFITSSKNLDNNRFIVFSDDSIFTKSLVLVENEHQTEANQEFTADITTDLEDGSIVFEAEVPEVVELPRGDEIAWYRVNPEFSRVVVECQELDEDCEDTEKLRNYVKKAAENFRHMKFHLEINEDHLGDFAISTQIIDSASLHSFEFNAGDLEKLIQTSISAVNFTGTKDWEEYGARWEEYGMKMDSLARVFEESIQDSMSENMESYEINLKKLKRQIEEKKKSKKKKSK